MDEAKRLVELIPRLRRYARALVGDRATADDLVQETLLRALANINSFEPGTNMSAWLFTILRNLFRSEYRKRRREVEDTDGSYAESLKTQPDQTARVERLLRSAANLSCGGDFGYFTIAQQKVILRIEFLRRVDHSSAADQQRPAVSWLRSAACRGEHGLRVAGAR